LTTPSIIERPGLRLAYGQRGDAGSPVLLIMGFTVPGSAWVHQVPALAARHRVAWYDHRGCGASRAAPGPYTMDLLAADARLLLDHLDWPAAHVVGVSMGGMVAQHLALAEPDRVRSLTLIATHAGGFQARAPRALGLWRFLQANLGRRAARFEALKRLLFPDDFLSACDPDWLQQVLLADFGRPVPFASRLSQLAAVMRHDTRRHLTRLAPLPTLVVVAERDLLVRPAATRRLSAGIPGARLHVFPEAGHGVIRQCHAALNRLLLGHFAAADELRSAGGAGRTDQPLVDTAAGDCQTP
jgi:pimeloyl-ACP methyl ester carboxylesterase